MFIFPYPNWHIFFRGVCSTTNQTKPKKLNRWVHLNSCWLMEMPWIQPRMCQPCSCCSIDSYFQQGGWLVAQHSFNMVESFFPRLAEHTLTWQLDIWWCKPWCPPVSWLSWILWTILNQSLNLWAEVMMWPAIVASATLRTCTMCSTAICRGCQWLGSQTWTRLL